MGWKRNLGYGAIGLVALVAAGGAYLWIAKPWVPPIVVSDPGPVGRRVTDDGLLANFTPGRGPGPRPAILSIGGSEGGIGTGSMKQADAFAARGFAVLSVSYFRAPGQSAKLENIPLETFDTALAWLRRQPDVDGDRIAVVGGSKGAEAALLVATRHPELKAVVAGMPSSVSWAGVDWNFGPTGASWTAAGKPLPFVPYGKMEGWEVASIYRNGLKTLPQHADAVIPVERVAAPILLICGEADTLWPSCPMARAVKARADASGRSLVTLLAYKDAGHAVFGAPRAADDPKLDQLASLGGSAEGNNAARRGGWPKTLAFLDRALAP